MSLHITARNLMSAPARIGLAVAACFVAMLAILFAVKPDMMMGIVHDAMSMM